MLDFKNFVRNKRPLICAHRGAKLQFPENSLPSFQEAARLKVHLIETDVHLTRDKELVIFHDESLDRTTDMKGSIKDYTLNELREMDIGYNFQPEKEFPFRNKNLKVLTIKELFVAFPAFWINIDLKDNDLIAAEVLADQIRKYNREKKVIVGSFHSQVLEHFRKLSPKVATSAHPEEVKQFIIRMRTHTLALLKPRYACFEVPIKHGDTIIVSEKFIQSAHNKDLAVMVWTINDEQTMHNLLDLGVDGLFTDNPQLLIDVVKNRKNLNYLEK